MSLFNILRFKNSDCLAMVTEAELNSNAKFSNNIKFRGNRLKRGVESRVSCFFGGNATK